MTEAEFREMMSQIEGLSPRTRSLIPDLPDEKLLDWFRNNRHELARLSARHEAKRLGYLDTDENS